jgi:hypothetical protein
MFRILGILVLGYVGYGLLTGQIYGRYHAVGRTFQRDADPWLYWSTLVVYFILAIALFFFFGRSWALR